MGRGQRPPAPSFRCVTSESFRPAYDISSRAAETGLTWVVFREITLQYITFYSSRGCVPFASVSDSGHILQCLWLPSSCLVFSCLLLNTLGLERYFGLSPLSSPPPPCRPCIAIIAFLTYLDVICSFCLFLVVVPASSCFNIINNLRATE